MTDTSTPPAASQSERVNVADRLRWFAASQAAQPAIVVQRRNRITGRISYETASFTELNERADRIACGVRSLGVPAGARLALLVKPGIDFVALVFGMLRAGVVIILIDPGMGRRNLIQCLADAEPEGFIAIPLAQMVRAAFRRRFPKSRWYVTVGPRWWFGGLTLAELERHGSGNKSDSQLPMTAADDPAAIIFTTGSTGPPKGVLYLHRNFDRQVEQIQSHYGIAAGNVNLACFPLFGLFNAAMGVTTVFPDMDCSRPATADPRNIVAAIHDHGATQSFASPAVWRKVAAHCVLHGLRLPTLREAYSAGAPVPPQVVHQMVSVMAEEGRMHTPYGATEALPVSTIDSEEIESGTRAAWAGGYGTCVGRMFSGIEYRVIRIVDGPICTIDRAETLPARQIGELIVRGPVVTPRYVTRVEANATAKIHDVAGGGTWHRMGDAGYLDEEGRFWFCGRVAHRVVMKDQTLYTDPVEGIFNQVEGVARSALVGVGPRGEQRPVVVIELMTPIRIKGGYEGLTRRLRETGSHFPTTAVIDTFLFHPSFPVDIRHNSKIFREQLAVWAAAELERNR